MNDLRDWQTRYSEKIRSEEEIFGHVRRGARIFIGSACGEPHYLVKALTDYVAAHPKAFFDVEIIQLGTLGSAPYLDERYKANFRHTSLFLGEHTRDAVNIGSADYLPVFLSQVPALFRKRRVPIDVALIQTTPPDEHGFLNLGISVDITKAAVQQAQWVVAQINENMPKVHGDGVIAVKDVDFLVSHNDSLLVYRTNTDDGVSQRIGQFVSRLVRDGDTIQVGYGSIPNAILSCLASKKHLGIHSELLTDGMVSLMQNGTVDNSRKELNTGLTIASFCMGSDETYRFVNNNPSIIFKEIDYTNHPLVIARHETMTAINMALAIDLTGQATAESIGKRFYTGIGGQADFMRGAVLATRGKTVLTLPSTAKGGEVSRILPFLEEGAGVTLNRGDIHYVVTEYGIAYLHGKSIRERAMELIAIAHPKFRQWLIDEARRLRLIYQDQAFVPGKGGDYPEDLEISRRTRKGLEIGLRPVKISDEPLLQDFFYALSNKSLYRRFFTTRQDMGHDRLQSFVAIDYTEKMEIIATLSEGHSEEIIGLGQYVIDQRTHFADVAFTVRDDYQNQGVGRELILYLTEIAQRRGLLGFTADVMMENRPMLRLFEELGGKREMRGEEGILELKIIFD